MTPWQKIFNDVIASKFDDLRQHVVGKYNLGSDVIALDPLRVQRVLIRVDKDLQSLADYHGIKPDRHKQTGTLTYWICKEKPVQVADFSTYDNPRARRLLSSVNEFFSVTCALALINAANGERLNIERAKGGVVDPFHGRVVDATQMKSSIKDFIYNLRNCDTPSSALAMQYYYIDITATKTTYLSYI